MMTITSSLLESRDVTLLVGEFRALDAKKHGFLLVIPPSHIKLIGSFNSRSRLSLSLLLHPGERFGPTLSIAQIEYHLTSLKFDGDGRGLCACLFLDGDGGNDEGVALAIDRDIFNGNRDAAHVAYPLIGIAFE